tara:strand:+ start:14951 stop:15232 length:282 start_codon:yes stop_codon:yes gene_type:complete
MKKKLTLTLDDKVIESAKNYAKKESVSVSSLVENYLKLVTASNNKSSEASKISDSDVDYETENTPLVKKMRGIMGDDKLTGNERLEYLIKKYG